jgi:hypothetical protein
MASGTGQYSIPAFRGVRPSGHAAASPVKVIQAYRFALDPSPARERSLRSHAGASRFAWNWGLNVTGMLANRRLARAVADQGFGQARRMLSYKTIWNGGTLLVADRWYPSSKTCSACGWRKPSLKLAERRFTCEACGLVMDRDQNAARNLLALRLEAGKGPGTARRAGTGPGARAYACGDHVRPGRAVAATPLGRDEAGTRHRICGSDWDRRRATDGCESYACQCSSTHIGDLVL